MKKGRVTPNLDGRQTSQNIDFFNSIRTNLTLGPFRSMAAFEISPLQRKYAWAVTVEKLRLLRSR